MAKIVGYLRVSTLEQGKSGLGLDAQRAAIERYAESENHTIIGWFQDVMSGKVDNRPELEKALKTCRIYRAKLVVAKLDRLSRNMSTIVTLLAKYKTEDKKESRIVAADSPNDSTFMLHIKATVAQDEREKISERTKAALQQKKARGFTLGNPNGAAALKRTGYGNGAGTAAVIAKANDAAIELQETIAMIQGKGFTTLQGIANELMAMEVPTARGGNVWYPSMVKNLLARLAA
ncbi:MAG: recombinase family protein [Magnetococcales bacterium]|nr:recombinase family protein [Magnetococcales bacterium]